VFGASFYRLTYPLPPMNQIQDEEKLQFGFRDIAVLVLSIYVLLALLAQALLPLAPAVATLLDRIDFFICLFFLVDFGIRLHHARSKKSYLKWGWIDLISSIPVWDPLRWGRAIRIVRILRVLRVFRSGRHLLSLLYRNRSQATLATAALAVSILVIVASVGILILETDPRSTIKTPFDALWWAVSTITTVGYGDVAPVTQEGKIVAMVLMVSGIALFGVFTGLFARLLIASEETTTENKEVLQELRLLRSKIEALERATTNAPSSESDRFGG
jgi:voltage-gated potassium channel